MYRHWTDSPIAAGFRLAQQALVNLSGEGIVTDGSGYVTAWTNSGTGGSAYDMDVVVGTLANSSVTTLNGHNAVNSTGSYGLESTAGQTIASGGTVFAVARFSPAAPSVNQNIIGARDGTSARWTLYSRESLADKFTFYQGATHSTFSEPYDTSAHVWSAQFNGDATSKLTVSGVGSLTADAGSGGWNYATVFADDAGGSTMQGYIAELIVFDSALTESEITQMQQYLGSKYAL